jgi:hypothetical protein
MVSITLLGVAFCSCDFALRCSIPGWVAVETGTRKRGRHGRFRSGVVRRDNCDCRARRERLRIQRPPHRRGRQFIWQLRLHSMLSLGLRRDIHERRILRLLCQQRSPFNRQFVRLFVYRVAVPRIAQQKVLLLGIVLALATRTGSIGGRRVMTPTLLVMIAIVDRATRTSAPGARPSRPD